METNTTAVASPEDRLNSGARAGAGRRGADRWRGVRVARGQAPTHARRGSHALTGCSAFVGGRRGEGIVGQREFCPGRVMPCVACLSLNAGLASRLARRMFVGGHIARALVCHAKSLGNRGCQRSSTRKIEATLVAKYDKKINL